jgi:hypothetical protein
MLPELRGPVSAQSSSAIQNLGPVVRASVTGSSCIAWVAGSSCMTSIAGSSWIAAGLGCSNVVDERCVGMRSCVVSRAPPGEAPSSCTVSLCGAGLVALPSIWLTSEYLAITSSFSAGIGMFGGFQSNRLCRWLPLREAQRIELVGFNPGRPDE